MVGSCEAECFRKASSVQGERTRCRPHFSAGVKDNSEVHDGTSEADCGDDQTKTLWPSGGLEPAY